MIWQHFNVRLWLISEMFGMVAHFPGHQECTGSLLFLCAHLGQDIFLGVPLGTENYFQNRVVPAPDGTIYLVDINGTRYWGSI